MPESNTELADHEKALRALWRDIADKGDRPPFGCALLIWKESSDV